MGFFDRFFKSGQAAPPTTGPHPPAAVRLVPRALAAGSLADLDLGQMPAGRLVTPFDTPDGPPVAWVSELGSHRDFYARMLAAYPQTGLWPLLVAGMEDDDLSRPWFDGELDGPRETPGDAIGVLRRRSVHDAPESAEATVEFDRSHGDEAHAGWRNAWAGLAAPAWTGSEVTLPVPDQVWAVALVPAARPADAPWQLGWQGPVNHDLSGADQTAVLRSWEERFGAVLVELSFDIMRLRVATPPDDPHELTKLGREHYRFCPDIIDQGVGNLTAYLDGLQSSPDWAFWWD